FTGFQFNFLGLGQPIGAGLFIDGVTIVGGFRLKAVVDTIFGFKKLATDLGQRDNFRLGGLDANSAK
ncbi:MAG: hypothetical protein O2912_11865, partial [Proteobacteria bacterium]|nr:hypothetical protein [Pseudomonadota bacterium]